MERFQPDGHLTGSAIQALAAGEDLDELTRLELAEHLAFCDLCLQRYTDALANTPLLVPDRSCQGTLWVRVRKRTLRLVTSRYATAAAAVVLALTMVWGGGRLPFRGGPSIPSQPRLIQQAGDAMNRWASTWPQAMDEAFSGLTGLFDDFSGGFGAASQGGN